jgi:hypothetical protein
MVAATPSAGARFRAADPDDVRYRLDIRSVDARGSHGRFRVRIGFYERIPWRKEWPVARVYLNSRGSSRFDYDLSTSRRGPRRFRCELRRRDNDRLILTSKSFSSGRRWLSCGLPRRRLRPDRRIEWSVIAYFVGYGGGTDRAPDNGVYPHA